MIGELFQPMHLLVVGLVALFLFGPKKLPELGRSLGKTLNEFKRSMAEEDSVDITAAKERSTAQVQQVEKGTQAEQGHDKP